MNQKTLTAKDTLALCGYSCQQYQTRAYNN